MATLQELLDRVEAASGADRGLDFELHIALVEDEVWPATDMRGRITNPNSRMSDYLAVYRDVIKADDQDFTFPRYCASLDAALALVERVLGTCAVSITCNFPADTPRGREATARIGSRTRVMAPTPALALLAALLRALIAKEASDAR